jgi:NTE family protein
MIHRMCARHASGLDVMSLPRAMMEGRFGGLMYAFLHALRKSHDFIVIVPPDGGLCLKASMDEADRLLRVEDAAATTDRPADEDPRRVWSVRLETGQPAPLAPGTFRVPWGGVPADGPIPVTDQRARRALTRLARRLGGVSFGFAMGSGAAMGYVLIGFLKALERNGLYPDIISGTSMGALIGSFYAMGKTPAEIEEISRGITKAKIWSLMDFAFPFPRQGIMHGNEVLSFLKSILGPRTFAELDLPFACVATDILNGEEVVLRHGKVAEAVRASLSLPFFFKPFYLNGRYLVDGGLVDPVPTDVAAAMGADVLIAVNITTKPAEKRLPGFQRRQQRFSLVKGPNILQVMMKTIDTMQWGIARARQAPAHIVLEPDISAFTWADFHRAADITRTGEEYIETMMPKIKSFFPMFAAPPARPS